MLKIAICDDEYSSIETLYNLLSQYACKNHIDMNIHTYKKGEELLNSDINSYDILFLDVNMQDEQNGIETARKIRQHNKNVLMIYVSGYIQYAPEGYSVKAFAYILKNDLSKLFESVMDDAMAEIKYIDYSYDFNINGEYISLPLTNIEYVESFDKTIEIHTINHPVNKYILKIKLSDFYDAVQNKGFLQIHKSYVINVRYTKSIKSYTATLISDIRLPVAQKRWKEVLDKYLEIKSKI